MKRFKLMQCAISILVTAMTMGLTAGGAQATEMIFNISGVFDTVGAVPANELAGLINTPYSASFEVSSVPSATSYTELNNDGSRGWVFNYGYTNSLMTQDGSYTNGVPVVVTTLNNFNYDGSQGMLSAGIYDIISFSGWLYDNGAGHIWNNQVFFEGENVTQDFQLIGTSDLFADGDSLPFGSLDLSQVLYGQYFLSTYWDGVLVGQIEQDPPLYLIDGVLTGAGMTVAVQTVPEPATLVLLGMGLAGLGFGRRKRASKAAAF